MKANKKTLIIPILLITVGIGWLLTNLGVAPRINWVWTLGLAMIGLLTFAIGGFDKVTVVIGPLFIIASCLSILRQTNRLNLDIEIPILVTISGILLLISQAAKVPIHDWIIQEVTGSDRDKLK